MALGASANDGGFDSKGWTTESLAAAKAHAPGVLSKPIEASTISR
jgi:hypothetical protein